MSSFFIGIRYFTSAFHHHLTFVRGRRHRAHASAAWASTAAACAGEVVVAWAVASAARAVVVAFVASAFPASAVCSGVAAVAWVAVSRAVVAASGFYQAFAERHAASPAGSAFSPDSGSGSGHHRFSEAEDFVSGNSAYRVQAGCYTSVLLAYYLYRSFAFDRKNRIRGDCAPSASSFCGHNTSYEPGASGNSLPCDSRGNGSAMLCGSGTSSKQVPRDPTTPDRCANTRAIPKPRSSARRYTARKASPIH